jgi:hypothetical protein
MSYAMGMAVAAPIRLALAISIGLGLVGCSHTFYQFHIDNSERNAILNTRNTLAVAVQDPNAIAAAVDLNGRRAVETLVAGMSVEQTNADEQYQRLMRTLYLGVMAEGEDPLSAFNQDVAMMAARVAHRAASSTLDQMGLGGIASTMMGMIGMGDDDGQRLGEMQASLARTNIGMCTELYPIISYNAGILGHIHSDLANNDPVYLDWRERVRSIHLVRFACPGGHVLMVLTQNHGESDARAIGWQSISDAQWQAMEPQLRYSLDLPQ